MKKIKEYQGILLGIFVVYICCFFISLIYGNLLGYPFILNRIIIATLIVGTFWSWPLLFYELDCLIDWYKDYKKEFKNPKKANGD